MGFQMKSINFLTLYHLHSLDGMTAFERKYFLLGIINYISAQKF